MAKVLTHHDISNHFHGPCCSFSRHVSNWGKDIKCKTFEKLVYFNAIESCTLAHGLPERRVPSNHEDWYLQTFLMLKKHTIRYKSHSWIEKPIEWKLRANQIQRFALVDEMPWGSFGLCVITTRPLRLNSPLPKKVWLYCN